MISINKIKYPFTLLCLIILFLIYFFTSHKENFTVKTSDFWIRNPKDSSVIEIDEENQRLIIKNFKDKMVKDFYSRWNLRILKTNSFTTI